VPHVLADGVIVSLFFPIIGIVVLLLPNRRHARV
jgi:hypothetical protein